MVATAVVATAVVVVVDKATAVVATAVVAVVDKATAVVVVATVAETATVETAAVATVNRARPAAMAVGNPRATEVVVEVAIELVPVVASSASTPLVANQVPADHILPLVSQQRQCPHNQNKPTF